MRRLLIGLLSLYSVSQAAEGDDTIVEQAWLTPAGTEHIQVFVPQGNFWRYSRFWIHDKYKVSYTEAFWIDKYEVSNALYQDFRDATGHREQFLEVHAYYIPIHFKPSSPAVGVTWQDADDYCAWAGGRLPTGLEWEKAARGSTDRRMYPWGDEPPRRGLANYGTWKETGLAPGTTSILTGEDRPDSTDGYWYAAPVDAMPDGASPYGALNMVGNVSEYIHEEHIHDYLGIHHVNAQGGDWKRSAPGLKISLSLFRILSLDQTIAYNQNRPGTYKQTEAHVGFRCCRDEENTSIERKSWGRIKRQWLPGRYP